MNKIVIGKSTTLFLLIACVSVVFIFTSGVIDLVDTNFNKQEKNNVSIDRNQVIASNRIEVEEKSKLVFKSIKTNEYIKVHGVSEDMYTPEYWINKINDADHVLMNRDEIVEFNANIIKSIDKVYDIRQYKESLGKDELTKLINEYKVPNKTVYNQQGDIIQQNEYISIINNQNIKAITDKNSISYGFPVRRTSLRSFPTDMGVYDGKSSELDRFQETGCQIGEPLLILHESTDKEWLFVQMYNYRGWIKSKDIATANNKEQVFSYTDSSKFIVVIENQVLIEVEELGKFEFNMGAKIPISQGDDNDIKIILPIRDEEGGLKFTSVEFQRSDFFNNGYLPYTKENVFKQAFKILGTSYDWGDKNGGYDCSSYIMSIYKTFGIYLPRNAGQQAMIPGKKYVFNKTDSTEKREIFLKDIEPGSSIFMPGHTMLYLGENNGIPFIIHSFVGYSTETQNGNVYVPINSTTVTPAIIHTSSGSKYINSFTTAVSMIKQ